MLASLRGSAEPPSNDRLDDAAAQDPTCAVSQPKGDLTDLLHAWRRGETEARDEVLGRLYSSLHQLAGRYLRNERREHTLQPTALVHELYLQLARNQRIDWKSRTHFLAVSGRLMRRVLVDHARERRAQKRPQSRQRVEIDTLEHLAEVEPNLDVLELESALERLEAIDERAVRVVELRWFAGLSVVETADVLASSPATVKRDWAMAKAWLWRELQDEERRGDGH